MVDPMMGEEVVDERPVVEGMVVVERAVMEEGKEEAGIELALLAAAAIELVRPPARRDLQLVFSRPARRDLQPARRDLQLLFPRLARPPAPVHLLFPRPACQDLVFHIRRGRMPDRLCISDRKAVPVLILLDLLR